MFGECVDLWETPVYHLPCPQLRQLRLHNHFFQSGTAGGRPGVLHHCSRLTALELHSCGLRDIPGTAAAIAALPELKHLCVSGNLRDDHGRHLFPDLQLPLQLTYLRLEWPDSWDMYEFDGNLTEHPVVRQLSGLVNLGHLELDGLPDGGVLDGLLAQLTQLTCLDVSFDDLPGQSADYLQSLSKLTALQQLSIDFDGLDVSDLSGVQHLSQLTSLELMAYGLKLGTASTRSWVHQTALKRLALRECVVQPQWLASHMQLQSLSLELVRWDSELLGVVSHLSLLTELHVWFSSLVGVPAAAFKSLTASTKLCRLSLRCHSASDGRDGLPPPGCSMFGAGVAYPHLHTLDLWCGESLGRSAPAQARLGNAQELQQICSCCPALGILKMTLRDNPPPTALLPLLQLPELTQLVVCGVGAAVAAVVGVAVRLTGLKQLMLGDLHLLAEPALLQRDDPASSHCDDVGLARLANPVLLQLTVLTALEKLTLHDANVTLHSKGRWGRRPNVWVQLVRYLLGADPFWQALQKPSGASAAALELKLAQLATTLSEDSAAHQPPSCSSSSHSLAALDWLSAGHSGESCVGLLQLPEAAQLLVLQQLDQHSLACTAVTCSQLSQIILANISGVRVCCSKQRVLDNSTAWLEQHRNSLTDLKQLTVVGSSGEGAWAAPWLRSLPCAQLCGLHLEGLQLQLEPIAGCPGVLHDCNSLTALELQRCSIEDGPVAAAAIAALMQLQKLRLVGIQGPKHLPPMIAELELNGPPAHTPSRMALQLTHLSLDYEWLSWREIGRLSELSGLINLRHLELHGLHSAVAGDFLSQLGRLTCLHVHEHVHYQYGNLAAELLRHLSCLTALQQLLFHSNDLPTHSLSGVGSLSQLTGLDFSSARGFSISSSDSWVRLTALKRLVLKECTVQPGAFSSLTQLQTLSLTLTERQTVTSYQRLLAEVAKLSFLTDLQLSSTINLSPPPPVAGFTAFTASTNLCCLQLGFRGVTIDVDVHLFRLGAVYPRLRLIKLTLPPGDPQALPSSKQQLQRLCSCCPALKFLYCSLSDQPSAAALLPLLQLSALTRLGVHSLGAAAVVGVVAQLTGLKQLLLGALPQLADPSLLQLTALTGLEGFTWLDVHDGKMSLHKKVPWCGPPDVWLQLQQYLLWCGGFWQALVNAGDAAAALPAELELAQFAATAFAEQLAATALAEQLAASSLGQG